MQNSYKDSGVDIEAGEKAVDNIKDVVKSTFNKNVITGLGHFGAFYELDLEGYNKPVMVSSVDGVGTKLKVAIDSGINNSVGQDLVNHCVNDIAVCGAKPLYFMDYMAFGKLDTTVATDIVKGFAIACKENGVALIGGETAEMPGLYQEKDYDLSGTIVGIVDKNNIINGETITKHDVLIGFKSNGLHTNGYSLARNVLLSKYKLDDEIAELGSDLKTELLKVHKSYLLLIQKLISDIRIKGFSHITGGGIIGNTKRIVPDGLIIELDWNAWKLPAIFKLIQKTGDINDDEMRKVFNMGIGLIAVINKKDAEKVFNVAKQFNEEVIILGKII